MRVSSDVPQILLSTDTDQSRRSKSFSALRASQHHRHQSHFRSVYRKSSVLLLLDSRTSDHSFSQPKNAAKEKKKEAPKAAANGAAPAGKAGKKKAKSGRAGRPKAKTAEELDAEMQDYFGSGEAAPADGTAAPAAATNGGDTGMDEVL